jgi:DNA processing protein
MVLSQSLYDELALWFVTQHAVSGYQSLMAFFHSASDALKASPEDWKKLGIHKAHPPKLQQWQQESPFRQQFDQAIKQLNPQVDRILRISDAAYPQQLKQIDDPPPILFVRGNEQVLTQPQIAMVGSRKPSPAGAKIAHQFAQILSEHGFWITSGLAYGIDSEAHAGALQAGQGRTIAVLGTGINLCYPASHQHLYQQIIQAGGAIISELTPNSPAKDYHFPKRNRIVSGLSLATLVVEAALKSGSLITARSALEQNRQVFAIPGHIYNEQSKGCHQLIREGALLIDDPLQIIEELDLPKRWQFQAQKDQIPTQNVNTNTVSSDSIQSLNIPAHLQATYHLLDWVGQSMDDLVERSQLDIATLGSQLMELELFGFIVQQGGLFLRCRLSG